MRGDVSETVGAVDGEETGWGAAAQKTADELLDRVRQLGRSRSPDRMGGRMGNYPMVEELRAIAAVEELACARAQEQTWRLGDASTGAGWYGRTEGQQRCRRQSVSALRGLSLTTCCSSCGANVGGRRHLGGTRTDCRARGTRVFELIKDQSFGLRPS